MHAFVVLGLVFSFHIKPRDWLGKTSLFNDLFCVQWDIKPQLSQSVMLEECLSLLSISQARMSAVVHVIMSCGFPCAPPLTFNSIFTGCYCCCR